MIRRPAAELRSTCSRKWTEPSQNSMLCVAGMPAGKIVKPAVRVVSVRAREWARTSVAQVDRIRERFSGGGLAGLPAEATTPAQVRS